MLKILLVMILFTANGFAATESSIDVNMPFGDSAKVGPQQNELLIDFAPTVTSDYRGIGFMYQRELSEHFSVGPFISYLDQSPTVDIRVVSVRYQSWYTGLEARYKFNDFNQSGFYLSGSLFELQTTANGQATLLASFRESGSGRTVGERGALGYLYWGKGYSAGQFFVDGALGYGTSVETENYQTTIKFVGSMYYKAALGFAF